MRETLQKIKDTPVYKNYTANYKLMVTKKNLTRESNSENMFRYYVNTVQIMDMMRDAIVQLRARMKYIIRLELYAVDREYILGIAVLSILVIISPMMIYLVRNAVTSLQVG